MHQLFSVFPLSVRFCLSQSLVSYASSVYTLAFSSNCLIALLHLHNSPSERFIIVGISAFLSFEHCILHPAIEVLVGVTLFLPSRSDARFRNQTDNNTIMTTPGCLSPIWQWIKTQFRSKREPKQLEIVRLGPAGTMAVAWGAR